MALGDVLWQPDPQAAESTQMGRFAALASERTGRDLHAWDALWAWSVDDLEGFWGLLAEFLEIDFHQPAERVLEGRDRMPGATWFPGAELNFAAHLLRRDDDGEALVAWREDGRRRAITYRELRRLVARAARGLRDVGVGRGDVVAGFLPNCPEAVIGMLAATSLGATWSSCSPDFGRQGVLDRFGQVEPKVLFGADGYLYGGKSFDSRERLGEVAASLPTTERIVLVPFLDDAPELGELPRAVGWADFLGADDDPELTFTPVSFSDPLYVMYSSGTTGLPKCLVQGVGGILLNQLKEHRLHCDLRPEDRIFYFTTCGWMMWNWLVSSLATGATVVLFDGNPFHPDPLALWRMAEEERVTVFGTSAKFLLASDKADARPGTDCDLSTIRLLLSTGSPLPPEGFEWVHEAVSSSVQLASISGGTDLNGCFALGNPLLPVHSGEIQCRGLGMKVEAHDGEGRSVVGELGELACTEPFPSMPLYFWNDPDGERYRKAYFEREPGTWLHGDFVEITERGTLVIQGRSDATLNPGGVRIGTAEVYRVVEQVEEIEDSIVIGQDVGDDVRVVLFVKLAPDATLDEQLKKRIVSDLRREATPRHVPAVIAEVTDIPYTISGKKVELAVREVVHGRPVKNADALKNPEALELYADRPELENTP